MSLGNRIRRAAWLLVASLALATPAVANTFSVTSTADDGSPGTLRWAINSVNSLETCSFNPPHTIAFALTGAGPHTISPTSALPALTCANTTIDGYTQSGATANTDIGGSNNANILIVLNGGSCGACDGITLTGSGTGVKGLSIHSFDGVGVKVNVPAGGAFVYGNYIGTDPGGMTALGNGDYGVSVLAGHAEIGSSGVLASRNLITDNTNAGVWIQTGATASLNHNQVGGLRNGDGSVGNHGPGIYYEGASSNQQVYENFIRHNTGEGIRIDGGDAVAIHQNSIHGNGTIGNGPGIDLLGPVCCGGVSPNDYGPPHDADGGANGLANHPDIISVQHVGVNTVVTYEVKSAANLAFRAEFFSNSSAPASRSGETFEGDAFGVTDATGYATGTKTIEGIVNYVSMTASYDSCGDLCYYLTSEFSPAVAATSPLTVTNTADSGPGSLRAALAYANSLCLAALADSDRSPKRRKSATTISFSIPGAGPHVISPATELHDVDCGSTVIDGYTQPGSSKNTRLDGSNDAVIKVVLDGSSCGSCNGLRVNGGSTEIHGLAIVGFNRGIVVNVANAYIRGNWIGYNPAAGAPQGNSTGIYVEQGNAVVGSDSGSPSIDAAYSNLITGGAYGIFQFQGTMIVLRNLIGGLPNGGSAGAPAGASIAGVFFANLGIPSSGSSIHRNFIRHNGGSGIIAVGGGHFDAKENLIYNNTGQALDLGWNGITANDAGDADTGPNSLLNFPAVTSVSHSGGNTTITAELDTQINGQVARFEFYANSSTPTVPQGETFLGATTATVGFSVSNKAFTTLTIPGTFNNISATATYDVCAASCIATSEFSPPVAAAAPPTVAVTFSPTSLMLGNQGSVRIVVSNTNATTPMSGIGYNFELPPTLGSPSTNIGADCFAHPGEFSAGPTGTGASVSGLALVAGGTCTLDVMFHASSPGTFTYPAGGLLVSSSAGAATNAASTTLVVSQQAPAVSLFLPATMSAGVDGFLTIAVSRGASDPVFSSIGATLTLPGDGTVFNPSQFTPGCGAGGSAPIGGNLINASGGSISHNGGCSLVSVRVVFATPGTHTVSLPAGALTYMVTGSSTVWSNTSPISFTVTVTGAPVVSLAPSPLAFGNVVVGSNAASTVTLSNTGNAGMSVLGITMSNVPTFTISHGCPTSLAPAASCVITVGFAPTAVGNFSETLTVTTSASGSPHTVAVTGTGVAPGLNPSVSNVAFGDQTIDTPSAAQLVTVTNSGTSNLTLSAITINGDFSFSGCATPITLVPGASCTLSITFFPTALGPRAGSISITSDASGSPHVISLSGTGTPVPMPAIALAPGSATFAAIVGGSASQVFALSNTGNANLDISSITIGVPQAPAASRTKVAAFTQANDCPASLAPSAACNITVTYAPIAPASESAELQVFSNAVPSPMVASLSGTATPGAAVTLSATTVAFPPQFMGIPSAAQTVTLTNTGTGPLEISNIVTSGDFGYSGCGFPITLASGASCSFAITFRPLTEGPHAGSIAITSNASGSPHAISLSGTGVALTAPQISLSPSSLGFGTVRIARTVTLVQRLTNVGAAPLSISSIAATGAFFSQSHNCATTLAVAAACDISVTYAPTATGPHSGQIVIHSNAIPSPHIAALSGTGQAIPPPFLDVDEAVVFGGQVVGTTTRRTLTLGNAGGEPLRISALQIFGAGAAAFGVEGACETIAPGATCDIAVTFVPTELADFAARLDIVSNHSGGVQQVALSGSGIPTPRPELAVSVGGLGFGNQAVGTTGETRTFTLTSVGQVGARVFGFEAPPDYQVNAGECPATLAPQASCQVHVTFRPIASGARVGRITIASDGASSPNSVSVTGVGCRFFSLGAGRNPARLCAP